MSKKFHLESTITERCLFFSNNLFFWLDFFYFFFIEITFFRIYDSTFFELCVDVKNWLLSSKKIPLINLFCKFIEFNLNIKEIILIEKKKCYARATKFIRMFGHVQDSFKTIKTTIKLVDFYQAALVLKNIVFFLFSKHNEHIKRSLNLWGKKIYI